MARRNFAEILLSAKIDIKREYSRLYELFYKTKDDYGYKMVDRCEKYFRFLPFKGRCLSLQTKRARKAVPVAKVQFMFKTEQSWAIYLPHADCILKVPEMVITLTIC